LVLEILALVVAVLVVTVVTALALVTQRRGRPLPPGPPAPGVDYRPGVGDDAEVPRDTAKRPVATVALPDVVPLPAPDQREDITSVGPPLEIPEPSAGRLTRLRARLARSQGTLGRGLFALLSRDVLDEDTWEEVEDTLLQADMGVRTTSDLVERLRRDPLARAMRPDKVILAALAATLRLYRAGIATAEIPIWRQIAAPLDVLERRARVVAERTGARAAPTASTIGGGSLPGQTLDSWAVVIEGYPPQRLLATLRAGTPTTIGRIVDDAVVLDLRTVDPSDDHRLADALRAAVEAQSAPSPT